MFSPVFVRSFSHYSHLFLKRLSNFVYIYLPKLFLFLILAPMEILWKQGNFCSSFVSNFWIQSFNAIFGQSQERMRERINGHFCIGHTRTYWLDCNLHTRSSLTHTHTLSHPYTHTHTHIEHHTLFIRSDVCNCKSTFMHMFSFSISRKFCGNFWDILS